MVLIDSLYINNSGGLVLLKYLVESAEKQFGSQVFYLFDERVQAHFNHINKDQCLFMQASLKNRKAFYSGNKTTFSSVLCFGNLPPSVKVSGSVYAYIHNLLFLEIPKGYPLKQRISKRLKSLIFQHLLKNADYYIFQTTYGKQLFIKKHKVNENKVLLFPFFDPNRKTDSSNNTDSKSKYVFVSDGNPHKNHINLLKAWEILHNQGFDFELHLTVSSAYPALVAEIGKYQNKGIRIINHGSKPALELYQICHFLIYPSLIESFGLGLIEATLSGLDVVAADLPYVHAVVEPSGCFDPASPTSIAHAVANTRPESAHFSPSKLIVENEIHHLLALLT